MLLRLTTRIDLLVAEAKSVIVVVPGKSWIALLFSTSIVPRKSNANVTPWASF